MEGRQDDFYREIDRQQREERKAARKAKWAKREQSFWRTFLFTENGKPKSSLLIYTFCLSFVFLGFYIAAFCLVIDLLAEPLAGLPPFWGNLLQSAAVGAGGAALSALLHLVLPDKRLAFGTHLWLALYAVACTVTLAVFLEGDREAIGAMLVFMGWFAAIPVAIGLVVTALLFRRDYRPPRADGEPEWKKYTRPR